MNRNRPLGRLRLPQPRRFNALVVWSMRRRCSIGALLSLILFLLGIWSGHKSRMLHSVLILQTSSRIISTPQYPSDSIASWSRGMRSESNSTNESQLQSYMRITQRWMQRATNDRFMNADVAQNGFTFNWVEMHHCDVSQVNVTHFVMQFVQPVVPTTIQAMLRPHLPWLDEANLVSIQADMEDQLTGQLLEQYVTSHQWCNFSRDRPSLLEHSLIDSDIVLKWKRHTPSSSSSSRMPWSTSESDADTSDTRLLFVISAYHDVPQLARLVAAVHLPQHYIVIHLDEYSDDSLRQEIQTRIVAQYDNVWCVPFGAVVYRTHSLSRINLRLLRWVTLELQMPYDYVILCDGLAFPLHAPNEFLQAIRSAKLENGQPREVWLGALTHKGQSVAGTYSDHLLRQKRVIYTRRMRNIRDNSNATWVWKMHQRLPRRILAQYPPIPDHIRRHMLYKSTSGNQGIYSRNVVEQLLHSDSVMELFALSKYGCCCCLEERNWIAALSMIGYAMQALQQTSMFQLWGGSATQCQGSMSNAVLSRNASICYRTEDPNRDGRPMYFYGSSLEAEIVQAQQRGVLMARKFRSTDENGDRDLIEDIKSRVWKGIQVTGDVDVPLDQ